MKHDEEYILVYAPLMGFILINKKTMDETILSEAEALKWSKKNNVSISVNADKHLDEILGFLTYGKTWRNVNINVRN